MALFTERLIASRGAFINAADTASTSTSVSTSAALDYAIYNSVAYDFALDYAIGAAPATASISADATLDYSIVGSVSVDVIFTYSILGGPLAYTPSAARTIKVQAASLAFSAVAGGFWDMSNPKQPRGLKDPNASFDISMDWTDWLADIQDTAASFSWTLDNGASQVAAGSDGALATLFLSGGATGAKVAATCRITTASTPPRTEDRTVYLTIEER